MGTVTVLNYMPTDPIVDAVGCFTNAQSSVGFPTFAFRERHEQKLLYCGPKWCALAGFGVGPVFRRN
jgi:hypothetical protein